MDIQDIRDRVLARRFILTNHAVDECDHEGLIADDLVSCVMSGEIIDSDFDVSHWIEYLIEGRLWTRQTIRVKAAVDDRDVLGFITVYSMGGRRYSSVY